MSKYSNMKTLREFIKTEPELFPLGADEIDRLEKRMYSDPGLLSDHDWLLLMTAEHMQAMWEQFDEADPVNGETDYYDYLCKGKENSHEDLNHIFEEIVVDDSFLSDYTIEEARQLIENAVSRGWKVPKELTPEVYIRMYTARKPSVDDGYIDQICHDRAYDCMCDGIETIEDAESYLLDIKMEGYTVPAKLTPELFLKLYKESEEKE